MSTPNQKTFYEGLASGKLQQVVPVGDRATDFLTPHYPPGQIPTSLQINKSVEFYVNDTATNGYNIFKKTLEL